MFEKTMEINMLYDFYHRLLTEKQQSYMGMYYREDYSLGEIAEISEVSRQTVYDTIRRTEELLISYEENLGLYDKFKQRNHLLKELHKELSMKEVGQTVLDIVNRLEKID